MKIMILVLSYNEGVFADFMKAQQQTWDSVKHPDVDVVYYYGGLESDRVLAKYWSGTNSSELAVRCSDDYEMMHWKFKLALDVIKYHKYDLIFRTNSCSYIDKERLLKVAETLPREKCYAGYHNGGYISGAGIFFSPDVLDILRDELLPDTHGAEDVLFGEILSKRILMIAENNRVDATIEGFDLDNIPPNAYHFRAKTSNHHPDRYRDIDALIKLHERIKK